jgi:hypothetical protein
MIDSVVNLLFRCPHRRLTRPVSPVNREGVPQGGAYVVCLDCGKQFAYDTREMRIGKPIATSHESSIVPQVRPAPHRKWKYALWASVPFAVAVGAVLKAKKPQTAGEGKSVASNKSAVGNKP